MPATRPSTRVQRRAQAAQPIAPRPASSRRRASTTTATSLPTTAAEGNVDHPSAAIVTTSSTPTTGASLSDATVQQIVLAVSQAVLASLNATGATSQSTSASETREFPVVASGIVSPSADATTQGHVACICFTACFR